MLPADPYNVITSLSSDAQSSFIEAVAETLNIPASSVSYTGLTPVYDSTSRRLLFATALRKLASLIGYSIGFSIDALVAAAALKTTDGSSTASTVESQLSTKGFAENLAGTNTLADALGVSRARLAAAAPVVTSAYNAPPPTVSSPPSVSADVQATSTFPVYAVIGGGIGGLVFIAILAFIYVRIYHKKKAAIHAALKM